MELRLRWKHVLMPRAYQQRCRQDAPRIVLQGEVACAEIARDFGISEACVSNWVRMANIEDWKRPGTVPAEASKVRVACKRMQIP